MTRTRMPILGATLAGFVALSIVAIPAAALAQHAGHSGHGTMSTTKESNAKDAASTTAFKAANMRMHRDMDIAYSGNADVDFVRGMIPHHQGAIDMAKIELAHGKDPELRKLAESIIADQEREIAAMRDWLKKNGK